MFAEAVHRLFSEFNMELLVTPVVSESTPTRKFLARVRQQVGPQDIKDVSQRAKIMNATDYCPFVFNFGKYNRCFTMLRATTEKLLELQTIISYPDRRGSGTKVMTLLCTLADELCVSLWLDACPFGSNRQHISLEKLVAFYQEFGFSSIPAVEDQWVNTFHILYGDQFAQPMLRNART